MRKCTPCAELCRNAPFNQDRIPMLAEQCCCWPQLPGIKYIETRVRDAHLVQTEHRPQAGSSPPMQCLGLPAPHTGWHHCLQIWMPHPPSHLLYACWLPALACTSQGPQCYSVSTQITYGYSAVSQKTQSSSGSQEAKSHVCTSLTKCTTSSHMTSMAGHGCSISQD